MFHLPVLIKKDVYLWIKWGDINNCAHDSTVKEISENRLGECLTVYEILLSSISFSSSESYRKRKETLDPRTSDPTKPTRNYRSSWTNCCFCFVIYFKNSTKIHSQPNYVPCNGIDLCLQVFDPKEPFLTLKDLKYFEGKCIFVGPN